GHLSMVAGVSAMVIISNLAWGLGYFGQPHIIVRFMGMRSHKDVPKARFIGTAWMVIGLYGAIFVGFIGFALAQNGTLNLADGEEVFILMSQVLTNPLVAGILLAAILSAIMSTIDSQLLVSSSALAEDFYKGLFRKNASDKELVLVARLSILIIALIALIIGSNPDSSVLDLVSYAWAGFGAAFGPLIILALFWKRITAAGAMVGMIAGAVTVVVWGNLEGGIFDLYEIVPGFLLNLILAVIVSQFTSVKPEMEEEFEKARELARS